jgi:hypothetical protein
LIGQLEAEYRLVVPDLPGGVSMRVAAGLGIFALFTGIPVVAQTSWSAPELRPDVARSCPINMHVGQGIGGAMVAVDENGVKRQVFAPRLRLSLNDVRSDKPSQRIASAMVTVHGTNGKPKPRPIDSDMDQSDMEMTLTVSLAEWGEPGVSGDFRLPGFTSANRIDLQSITYEDGSTWKLSRGQSCRVAPDPLMLIGH